MVWKVYEEERIHTGEEIGWHLRNELPYWYIEDGWIQRKYNTTSWSGALLVINTVARLAEAALHDPDLLVSRSFVIVKLKTHLVNGVTGKDFELAQKIEEVVMWHPSQQDGELEKTPSNPPYAGAQVRV